jgi:hypothetical protein
MRAIVFDTGPLISLAMNNLLWLIEPLKKNFSGDFYITESVRRECIERPLTSRKFKFEAIQILRLLDDGLIKVYESKKLADETQRLIDMANSIFSVNGNNIKNIQFAEMESVIAKSINAKAIIIDEFTTRTLLENPAALQKRMERKMNVSVKVDESCLRKFQNELSEIRILRSVELVVIAYEMGLFKKYYPKNMDRPMETLLEGLLWAIKLNGCSVSEQEIAEVMKIELK